MQETQETQVQSLGKEDPLEKEMATHFSIPAWEIPGTEESGSPCPCTLGAARVPTSQAAVPPSCSTLTGAELPQAKKSCV